MALIPSKTPDPSYNINKTEAILIQTELIDAWEPKREVFSLKHGDKIISVLSGISGFSINTIFRNKLKLRHQGIFFSSFFVTTGPAFTAYITHKTLVVHNLLLYQNQCLMCNEIKAISSITCNGFIYPLLLAPVANLAVAASVGYRVPYVYDLKQMIKLFWSIVRPEFHILSLMLISNAVITGIITYDQVRSIETVKDVLFKVQQFMDNQKDELTITNLGT